MSSCADLFQILLLSLSPSGSVVWVHVVSASIPVRFVESYIRFHLSWGWSFVTDTPERWTSWSIPKIFVADIFQCWAVDQCTPTTWCCHPHDSFLWWWSLVFSSKHNVDEGQTVQIMSNLRSLSACSVASCSLVFKAVVSTFLTNLSGNTRVVLL